MSNHGHQWIFVDHNQRIVWQIMPIAELKISIEISEVILRTILVRSSAIANFVPKSNLIVLLMFVLCQFSNWQKIPIFNTGLLRWMTRDKIFCVWYFIPWISHRRFFFICMVIFACNLLKFHKLFLVTVC